MKLYLTRHGDAVSAPVDAERPLSSVGLQQAEDLAQHLVDLKIHPTTIYHSGLVRAQQTAAIIGRALNTAKIEKIVGLRPNDFPEDILSHIETWSQDTMLVGHLPFMAILLSLLTEDTQSVEFYPTTTVCLTGEGKNWQIAWIYNPD